MTLLSEYIIIEESYHIKMLRHDSTRFSREWYLREEGNNREERKGGKRSSLTYREPSGKQTLCVTLSGSGQG